jgi:outer membrane lipoprotein-sorting protein
MLIQLRGPDNRRLNAGAYWPLYSAQEQEVGFEGHQMPQIAWRMFRLIAAMATCLAAWLAPVTIAAATGQGTALAEAPPAREIVARADETRFPQSGFQVDVKIATAEGDQAPELRHYRILSKGNDRTLVMTTYPAADRGQIMLMRDHDLWVFMPNVSQPVRLPLSQRLTGQVANGDLARANFAGDYVPELLRVEEIEGRRYYVLELTAVDRYVAYHRVLYWVDVEDARPHKAEFYTLSGNLLKVAHYRAFAELGGRIRPTQLVMQDALKPDTRSVMQYSSMKLREVPDKFFSKNYLKKLH